MALSTLVLLVMVLVVFVLMTRGTLRQEVGMPLAALGALCLAGEDGQSALEAGFKEFSRIALIFTAVAVPAHMLQRSRFLDWIGMGIGQVIGSVFVRTRVSTLLLVPAFSLTLVYMLAALFHNTTSILVASVVIFVICRSYSLKPLPVLAGTLVASNLGGFSTRWGDTPNIIEARQWDLSHADFSTEILPLNLSTLVLLICVVSFWLAVTMRKAQTSDGLAFRTHSAITLFSRSRQEMPLDRRLILAGLCGLVLAIAGPLVAPHYEFVFSALAIIVCVVADYSERRTETLLALGIETYATLAAIFVLAQVLAHSSIGIGNGIQAWLIDSGMSIWAIATASYAGTMLTEAASWASVAAPIVFAQAPTHAAAWALGSGIFAGSSSLITAASAGIILTQQTKEYPDEARVTFRSYLLFGLPLSLLMLVYYIVMLTWLYG